MSRTPDVMKERGLPLPVAVPRVHARGVYVIYDDGRPLVEAYDVTQRGEERSLFGMPITGLPFRCGTRWPMRETDSSA